MRVTLISCSKEKVKSEQELPARELYSASVLFRKSLRYAEATSDLVFIASAKYGVVSPEYKMPYYDKSLNDMSAGDTRDWGRQAANGLHCELIKYRPKHPHELTMLLGEKYTEAFLDFWTLCSHHFVAQDKEQVRQPLRGMQIGERLHWLTKREKDISREVLRRGMVR